MLKDILALSDRVDELERLVALLVRETCLSPSSRKYEKPNCHCYASDDKNKHF